MHPLLTSVQSRTASILVIEDTREFATIIEASLGTDGHHVRVEETGRDGLDAAHQFHPDLVVLDLMLPDMDGLDVCRELRTFSDAYVIMLTSRADEIDKVLGLALGADDYLTKPFSTRELSARVTAMLRRPRTNGLDSPRATPRGDDALTIDPSSREVRVAETAVHLTKIEFDLLLTLTHRPTMVHSREVLLELVWGNEWYDHHVVDVHIANLRRKIDVGRTTSFVKTVRGVGFRMAEDYARDMPAAVSS